MLLLNPYFLMIGGIFGIILGMRMQQMNIKDLVNFWIRFFLYFFRDSTKMDKYREKNPSISMGGWVFLGGWFLFIAGIVRFFGGQI